ncbi:unnamed protein product [Blepharisma stoltei]|uniref:Exocyst complex component Sec6 n=1 Tax=Blepharisma stoltei TaxID=1481888 RepID=A0AAU9JR40_9CILI|nr:unnamed protein product [Blepharisma stoltei]
MKQAVRYTEYIRELETDLEKLDQDMKEQVYGNYSTFIDTFNELNNLQSLSVSCYSPTLDTINSALVELLKPAQIEKISTNGSIVKGSIEWWQELPDEIDTLLNDEKYEECINLIEEAGKVKVTPESISLKHEFNLFVLRVIETIAKELQKVQNTTPSLYIGYLKRLDALPAAEDAYFLGKAYQLKQYITRLAAADNPLDGLSKQGQIFVSILRATIKESQDLGLSSSKLYAWMCDQINEIAWDIGEQFYLIENIQDLANILQSILKSCDSLDQTGLHMSPQIQKALLPATQKRIQEIYANEELRIETEVNNELWKPKIIQAEQDQNIGIFRLTSSCLALYQEINKIIQEAALFLDEHLMWSSSLCPVFVKTISFLFEKYVGNEKFDDKKDFKIVQVIACNLWNIASLIPSLARKMAIALKVPKLELNEILVIEGIANSRALDVLMSYSASKWINEIPNYLTTLQSIAKLQTSDELKQAYNVKHLQAIKEGVESVASATDRNSARMKQFIEAVASTYVKALEDLLNQNGGNFEIQEIVPGGFQQLIADLHMINIIAKNYEGVTNIREVAKGLVTKYSGIKHYDEDMLMFPEEAYEAMFKVLSLI